MTDDAPLRLAIFDFDGTLMDSAAHIARGMRLAFAAHGRPTPSDEAVRRVIGLGLVPAMRGVDPSLSDDEAAAIGHAFVAVFEDERARGGAEAEAPLFPGAADALARLAEDERLLLGVATGKGRHGLDHALDAHALRRFFTVTQTANDAPGKPHPAMVENCLAATGVASKQAVVIGDTAYDMEMARNAGVAAIGVAWGYHSTDELRAAGAAAIVEDFDALDAALEAIWSGRR